MKNLVRRHTDHRDVVFEAVCEGSHPSAREIFDAINTKKQISFGTVYRNLQILVEEGKISAVMSGSDSLHYDKRTDRHHHLHCKKCGRVFDAPIPYRSDFDEETARKTGFAVDFHTISFEGVCGDCAEDAHNYTQSTVNNLRLVHP